MHQTKLASQVEAEDVLDLLAGLVDKSLVAYDENELGQGRYRLLETVRQYGRDRSAETEEAGDLCRQHQIFFLALAEQAISELIGPKQVEWLDRLEVEYDNMRSVLDWCLATEDQEHAEAGLRLAGTLGTFWLVRGYLNEGRQWLGRTLKRAEEQDIPRSLIVNGRTEGASVWTRALTLSGGLASAQGDSAAAELLFEQAAALAREADDKVTLAYALRGLGWCKMYQKTSQDNATVQTLFEESLLLFRQVKDQNGIALSLRNLGDLAFFLGNYASARAYFAESLNLSRQQGNQHGIAGSLLSLARVAFAEGDFATAWKLNEEALPLSREIGDQGAVVDTQTTLGLIAHAQGNFGAAQALYEEVLPLSRQLGLENNTAFLLACLGKAAAQKGDHAAAWTLHTESMTLRQRLGKLSDIADGLEGFAALAQEESQNNPRLLSRAARLLGAAFSVRHAIGVTLGFREQEEFDRLRTAVQEELDADVFTAAFAGGKAMPMETAVAYALAGGDL